MAQVETNPKLLVNEIFHSIQGESSLVGLPFTFIRLTGCPLRCTYCDTTYSYTGGQLMELSSILSAVESHGTEWVCLTGGEPLANKHALTLVTALKAAGKKISIETDGEEDVGPYVGLAKLIMDIKTPESGEKAELAFKNLEKLLPCDEIKFIICSESDYTWAKDVCKKFDLESRFTVLFSPAWGKLNLQDLSRLILKDRLRVRLQTQLHKHIWGENKKGV